MGYTLASTATRTFEQIHAVFVEGFKGYIFPLGGTMQDLADRFRMDQTDLVASLVAQDGGADVGLCLMARRGRESRVAAMCIVPDHRGKGVGSLLLEEAIKQARQRGDTRMILEVFSQNEPALALYTKYGFVITKKVTGYRHPGVEQRADAALREATTLDLARALAVHGAPGVAWQIDPASVAAQPVPWQVFELEGAYALVNKTPTGFTVRAMVVPKDRRRQGLGQRMLQALSDRFPGEAYVGAFVTEGENADWLEHLGFKADALFLYEMACAL